MKKQILFKAAMLVLITIALFGIFSEPADDASWFNNVLLSKGIGVAAVYAAYLLDKRFSKTTCHSQTNL